MAKKYLFYNDYSEGAHPKILEALAKTNLQQEMGYGLDAFSLEATRLIKEQVGNKNVDVHFVHSGGMANLVALASMLNPAFVSVIAPASSHINVHEGGAIEGLGHKINIIPSLDGKITSDNIREVMDLHLPDEHMVLPKVVSITHATEVGTIYTKHEIEKIRVVCNEYNLFLYLDGARLGSALMVDGTDITLQDLTTLVDMFYIGGTKNGALLGEAIVINNPALQENFRRHIRQHAAHVAKGRVIGIQFIELMKDNLFFVLARHANLRAQYLANGIAKMGYSFLTESPTNQIFPILPNAVIKRLEGQYGFYIWKVVDSEHSAIRLVTSWATPQEAVADFLTHLKASTG